MLIACRSPAGSLEYGLFYKAMRGGVESQRPGVTAGSRTLVCARPADGRIQQAFPRKFTAGHAWLRGQTMDEKVPKLGTDYADYNRLCFADTPSINCDIRNDMGVRRQIERISMRMTEVKI